MIPQIPVQRGSEQRYWRRQANRRVRKARMTRNLLRWSVVVLVNLCVAAIVLYTGTRVFQRVTGSARFSLQQIEVLGDVRASSDAIRGALAPYLGRNLLDINLNEVAAIAATDPWVASNSVSRVLPGTLQIRLEERQPSALALIGGVAHLVDRTGYVIGDTGFARADDLPVLTGFAGLEGAELARAVRRGVDALERLRRSAPAFTSGVSELDLSRSDRLTVRTVLPGPRLLLDPTRVDRNVNPYLELSEEIRNRFAGSDYVDLRWRDRITVGPSSRERS